MRRPPSSLPAFLLVAALLALGVPAAATTMSKVLTDEELVAQAGYVLVGKINRVTSDWNAQHTQIFTYVDVHVERVLKGDLRSSDIQLRTLGGVGSDGIGMYIADMPEFRPNEEALLFLTSNPQELFPIVALNQGKIEVRTDGRTGEKLVPSRGASLESFAGRLSRIAEVQRADQLDPSGAGMNVAQPKEARP